MAVGQGDVQVSPLQLAVAYSALANGGTIITPHVGMEVESSTGALMRKIDPAPKRHLDINPLYLDEIRTGLRDAASQPGGTSSDVMGNFPQQVYGKTGTAQYIVNGVENDYAWYACFVPATATSKPITSSSPSRRAASATSPPRPVARQMLSQWFYGKPGRSSGDSRRRCERGHPVQPSPRRLRRRSRRRAAAGDRPAAVAGGARPRRLLVADAARRGHPYFYEHQAIYAGVGLVLALVISRFDYTRLREYRYVLYGLVIFLNLAVFAVHTPRPLANGRRPAGYRYRSSSSSPPSSARC